MFYAVERPAGLDRIQALAATLTPAGALWTLRTKRSGLVTEAATMAAGKRAGLVDVKVVSFSETVTAEKFVIRVARRTAVGRGAVTRALTGERVPGRASRWANPMAPDGKGCATDGWA